MPSTPVALSICVVNFIRQILCNNPTLKATFKTFLNSQILAADAEIALLGAQLVRLDILNSFAQLEIQTLAAVQNKIQADLNVVFGPMQSYATCPTISQFLDQAESGSTLRALSGLQNLIYTYNRRAYVANAISSKVKSLQNFVNTAQSFLTLLDQICGS
ncbi:MAG: hypothetical protein ACREBR_05590 [bacterium]